MSSSQNDQSTEPGQSRLDLSDDIGSAPTSNRSRVLASPGDIICGRGFHISNHRGNHNLHRIVNKYRGMYLSSSRDHKAKLIKLVLDEVKSKGAKFIRKVSNENGADEWEEVDDAIAYKKVSHALRLRTTDESNRDKGDIVVQGSVLTRRNSIIHPFDQLRPPAVPATSASFAANSAPAHHDGPIVEKPTDIVCGRGFHITNHKGNLKLHIMVNTYRAEYLKSHRSRKAKIIRHIIDEIKSTGARFVRRKESDDDSGAEDWEVVDDETAYNKVSHALRLQTKKKSLGSSAKMQAASALKGGSGTSTLNQQQARSMYSASESAHAESPQLPKPFGGKSMQSVGPNTLSTSTLGLPMNCTEWTFPIVPLVNAVPLWASAQQPQGPPMYIYDIRQQLYHNAICAVILQQLVQHPNL